MVHLRARGFKMARDVVAGGSHKMANFLSLIKSASAVCGLWVADTVDEYEEFNSIVALLLGYALAKGKRILVFQHTPCGKSMIDLCGVVQPIQEPDHLANICPAMIDKYLLRDMSMSRFAYTASDSRSIAPQRALGPNTITRFSLVQSCAHRFLRSAIYCFLDLCE